MRCLQQAAPSRPPARLSHVRLPQRHVCAFGNHWGCPGWRTRRTAARASPSEGAQEQQQPADGSGAAAIAADGSGAAIAATSPSVTAVNRLDIYKAIGVSAGISVLAGVLDHEWVDAHMGLSMSLVFCLGFLGIIVEEVVGLNKAAVALVMASSLWTIRSGVGEAQVEAEISGALGSVCQLVIFLLGAMTVVEVVDGHGGFKRVAKWIQTDQRTQLAWVVALVTFGMSAVLDNLTTTIVLLSVLQRAVPDDTELRKLLGALVVIAANAGGAWTPIGDVTTTMLWVNNLITPWPTMRDLCLPSLLATAVPVALLCSTAPELQGAVTRMTPADAPASPGPRQQLQDGLQERHGSNAAASSSSSSSSSSLAAPQPGGGLALPATSAETAPQPETLNRDVLVLTVGLGALLGVPLIKHWTGLPPWCGMLSGLGVLWMVTDALHFGESRSNPRVKDALRNVDMESCMFFVGVLLSVEALETAGLLRELAEALNQSVPPDVIPPAIGLVSAAIDNVPLVAATMGMFSDPQDSERWQLIALCAGTGGSLLVIGSASGVAYMGLEGASFGWYLRRVSAAALAGYVAAIACYTALHA